MRRRCLLSMGVFAWVMMMRVAPVRAEVLEFGVERPRVFSIQKRPYGLGHEFEMGFGVLPLDAFYVGLVMGGSYTYHFSDLWAWEIIRLHYSINFDTSLEGNLDRDYGVTPVRGGGERAKVFGSTSIVVKPLFGKLTLLNSQVVYGETSFVFGVGPFQSASGTGEHSFFDPALNLGVGFRFWAGDVLSIRFEVRDYLVLKDVFSKKSDLERQESGPENMLMFSLSVSFNFGKQSKVAQP